MLDCLFSVVECFFDFQAPQSNNESCGGGNVPTPMFRRVAYTKNPAVRKSIRSRRFYSIVPQRFHLKGYEYV